ncbi:MAG TPA: AraC family transcriptional regulator [Polyangiaceae bacterium]|nr:AraC family transcriptional regulator [Polyangiaceae bacterium]
MAVSIRLDERSPKLNAAFMAKPLHRVEVVFLAEGTVQVRVDGERVPSDAWVRAIAQSFAADLARAVASDKGDVTRARVADGRVLKALALMQEDPAKRWTVEKLARAVGLSRAAFARRFEAVTRAAPLRYLTRQRMLLAAELLRDSDASLAEIAARVGYESEFAFSRAFKRHHGLPPGVFRRNAPLPSTTSIRAAA